MKVTIVTDVESENMSKDEIKDSIYGIVSDLLKQLREIGIDIYVKEVSYPVD